MKALTETAAKANQDDGSAEELLKAGATSLKLQSSIDAATKELLAAEKEAAARKADSVAKLKALAVAEQDAAAAKAKVGPVLKEIAVKQAALDTAEARKESARIKARQAAQFAAEVKGVLAWRAAAVADSAARAAAAQAETAYVAMKQKVDSLRAASAGGPVRLTADGPAPQGRGGSCEGRSRGRAVAACGSPRRRCRRAGKGQRD